LREFLLQCHISGNILERLNNGESKSIVLSVIFSSLGRNQSERNQSVLLLIAKNLLEMRTFPDLKGWEDSKQKIAAAVEAQTLLRREYEKMKIVFVDTGDEGKKEVARKQREELQSHIQRESKFFERLRDIQCRVGTQRAGYDFEDWIYEFLAFSDIQARKPYKDKNGRQIDGALELEGVNFLIEAKCTSELTSVRDIDLFRSKIDTKADNTLGLFVSMTGFTPEAIDQASYGRTPFVLMDGTHLFNLVVPRLMGIKDVIQRTMRHAAQSGRSYLPVQDMY